MLTSQTRSRFGFPVTIIVLVVLAQVALSSGSFSPGKSVAMPDDTLLIGTWTGESICQVKDSPCRDERVVYHVKRGNKPGIVSITADKIVEGKAITMGTVDYTYDNGTGTLLNETDGRVWKFTVHGKKMDGTLTLADKTLYRRVTLEKAD